MNTSKAKPAVPVPSKIPVKRPIPVATTTSTSSRHEQTTTIKSTKPVPTISQPITPKHKTNLDTSFSKADTKAPQTVNKDNKENISLNTTKKPQDKAKGYTELKKNEERLSELVTKFEQEKLNHAQQIQAIEQKHKEELRAKDDIIRNLQYQLESAQKRIHNAENDLSTLQEDFSTITTRNKTLESLLEEVNVDVVSLERIPAVVVNVAEIERQFQEFKEAFENDYETTVRCIKQKEELLACMERLNISVPELEDVEEGEKEEVQPVVGLSTAYEKGEGTDNYTVHMEVD